MPNNLRVFNTYNDYSTADLVKPSVSYVVSNDKVYYDDVPSPTFQGKVKLDYSDGRTYSAECDSKEYLSTSDTRPRGYQYSAITSCLIGNCVYTITGAFSNCWSLTSVTIPNSVTKIGTYAFQYCSGLTSIDIPSGVTSIGSQAFKDCSSLTSINIPSGVTSIGTNAFSNCTSLPVINNIRYADTFAVEAIDKNTADNSIISGTRFIGDYAFRDCSGLTSVTIPNSVTTIGDGAFYNCTSLTSIDIPNSVTSIGSYAFYGCNSLTSIDIPNSVTSIGYGAFEGCNSLTSIDIPNSVTSIGDGTFTSCINLMNVTLGNNVTTIGAYAFENCFSLTSLTINSIFPPTLKSPYIFSSSNNYPIYVPSSSVNAYKTAEYWSDYADRIYPIPNS